MEAMVMMDEGLSIFGKIGGYIVKERCMVFFMCETKTIFYFF
jgi:hypothetical protein